MAGEIDWHAEVKALLKAELKRRNVSNRELGVQYKTAFVLAHKLREAMATEMKGHRLGGKGEVVEIDGA